MAVPFLLTPAQMECIPPHFPRSRGIPRVDDGCSLSGIISVIVGPRGYAAAVGGRAYRVVRSTSRNPVESRCCPAMQP
jgi:hypothetical protein